MVIGMMPNVLKHHPEIRRLRAPDDLVENRQHEEEKAPAQRQLAPALVGQSHHAVEHDRQQWLAESERAQQDRSEYRVDDGRLELDEQLVAERQRQRAEEHTATQ
jgi:hypothetical protein